MTRAMPVDLFEGLDGRALETLEVRAPSGLDVTFVIPMVPVGKGAARHVTIRNCRTGQVVGTRVHSDPRTESFEAAVAALAVSALPAAPLDEPVRLDLLVVLVRPAYLTKRHGRGPMRGRLVHPEGLIWCGRKPDSDNVRKAVQDGLRAFWRDDSRVCAGATLKCYAEIDGRPRVVVRVRTGLGDPEAEASALGLTAA